MQRVLNYRIQRLHPVRVYLDDLERVVSALNELVPNVAIETDSGSVHFIDELAGIYQQPFHQLTLRTVGTSPAIAVELTQDRTDILLDNAEHSLARGVQDKIAHILAARRQPTSWLLSLWVPAVVAVFLATLCWLGDPGTTGLWLFTGVSTAVWIAYWLLYQYVETRNHSVIVPQARHDAATLYERYEDQIHLGLASAAVGIVLGMLLMMLLR